jgi:hypothetical protein
MGNFIGSIVAQILLGGLPAITVLHVNNQKVPLAQ